jgi:hypothetical protein
MEFVADGRNINYAFAAGSIPPPNDDLWAWFDTLGITLDKQERSDVGVEVAVDEIIQLAMANRAIDIQPKHERFVLLAGDGAGYNEGKGFIKQLERVMKFGNEIEVVSWDLCCGRHLREFSEKNGTYRGLESAYNSITFINNYRWAE